jgi:uncharacterized protein YyaL (SSP411 family)
VGEKNDPETAAMLDYINSVYKPGKVVLLKDSSSAAELEKLAPFTKDQHKMDEKPTVYICRNFACEKPINSIEELKKGLY